MTHNVNIKTEHWTHIKGLSRLINALYSDEYPARIVGGAVRDTLRQVAFQDVDIATPLLPEKVMDILQNAKIKTIPTGLQHGTITAVSDGVAFEVTTLRKDISTDGRHAKVEFCDDWREDAMRRDFTINALYADPISGEIYDYFGGIQDLQNNHVTFIGNPIDRIEEDHLRILRYFRFLARFSDSPIDNKSLEACRSLSNRQMTLARERISDELIKILAADNPYPAVKLAYANDIFAPFLPEITAQNIDALGNLISKETHYKIAPLAIRRLAALLPKNLKIIDKIASRLKFSNVMRKSLLNRIKEQNVDAQNIRKIAYNKDHQSAIDQALLYSDDTEDALNQIKDWDIPKFECNGGAIIARGLPAGPIISKTLQQIREKWMDDGFPSGQKLDEIIDIVVDQNLLLISSDAKNS